MKFWAYVCGISGLELSIRMDSALRLKKKGNLHQLKTDSAERKVPVYCLLKPMNIKYFVIM